MRGKITYAILKALAHTAMAAVDVFDVIASSRYGASYAALEKSLRKRRAAREATYARAEEAYLTKQRLHSLLYKLKQDGLIAEEVRNHRTLLLPTLKGKQKLSKFEAKLRESFPTTAYPKILQPQFTIVTFDVPEAEKRKRVWLRAVLQRLGFRMIQKSVWMGKIKVPAEFLEDLARLRMLDFVEIFQITKSGSL